MKKLILATIVLASTVIANAAEVTVLKTNLPSTRGYTIVDTRFYVDSDMKEAYADISVSEQETIYIQDCSYRGGGRGPGHSYPGPFCPTVPHTRYNAVLSDKVKIEGITMNGDDVIYQGAEGDVVCGSMGKSRIFRVPTFYLSGKCELDGKVIVENGLNVLVVKFKTK